MNEFSKPISEAAKHDLEDRRLDLDWVRIGAFALLILYHIGMVYVPWDWHVKSNRPQDWLQPAMVLTNPWRLTILFIVAGAATRFMADNKTAWKLGKDRTIRLLPPVLFAMALIIPPQTWLQLAQANQNKLLAYSDFWISYITAGGGWSWRGNALLTPTWNHLWFVVYLLVYTLLVTVILHAAPRLLPYLQRKSEQVFGGWGLLIWPTLYFSAVHLLVAPYYSETHALFGDCTVHAGSLSAFLFGFLCAKSERVWSGFVSWRWLMLLIAITSYAAYAITLLGWIDGSIAPKRAATFISVIYGVDQWAWVATILGFARRHLGNFDNKARRYLTEAIFPYYIVHQTIIIGTAYYLLPFQLPLALEAGAIILATVAGCAITFELVRRVKYLRPLFGLKPLGVVR